MGAANVALAFTRWGQLPHRPFRALAFMALVSLDESRQGQARRVYFAGPGPLARAIGRRVTDDAELSPKDRSEVSAVLAQLREAGAITVLVRAGNGRRGEYRVELDTPQGEPTRPIVAELVTPQGEPQLTPQGVVGYPSGVTSAYPSGVTQGETRGGEEHREEDRSPESQPHLPPVVLAAMRRGQSKRSAAST